MDKKSLISRFTQAALMLALAAATGQAFANTGRASQVDNWCAKQPVSANPPQQSRPYRASGSSCATCHPAGGGNNAGNLNTLGNASKTCSGSGTTTTCGTSVNPSCISTAPTSVSITAPAAGTTLNVGQAATFQGQGTSPDGFPLGFTWKFSNGFPNATTTGTAVFTAQTSQSSITPASAGSVTATLEVRDVNGKISGTVPTRAVTWAAAANQAPNGAITAPASIVAGQAVTFQGAGTDPDNNTPLTFAWNFGSNATPSTSTAQNPSVTFNSAGTNTVTLTVRDSLGLADPTPATVSVTVAAAPQPPVANADSYSTPFGTTLNVAAPGVLANDTTGSGTLTAQLVTGPTAAQGTLTLNANGSFTFVPASGFSGNASFTYRASNGTTTSANATVTIAVSAAAAPTAAADNYSTPFGTTLTVAAPGVLANDTTSTGTLSAQLVTGPTAAQGTLTLNANGSFTFVPTAGFSGNASFTYRASNGTTTSANATVTIAVGAAPVAPVANADNYGVQSGQTLTVAAAQGVLANDTNPSGTGTLAAQLVTGPTAAQGTLSLNANGGFTFTPASGFVGDATFTYRASNGTTTSAPATVTIVVVAPPPPVACVDTDGDGYSPEGGSCGPIDCNDNNAAINPGIAGTCGAVVNDCLSSFFVKPVVITLASWVRGEETSRLTVSGNQANAGAAVTIFNAGTGALIGTTTTTSTGTWSFSRRTSSPPCGVRVEINGATADRAVSGAPSTCIGPLAPNGTITAPANIVAGQAVTFQGAGTDPDNNTPLTFSWNFGTGASPATSAVQNPSVTFAAAGTYTVTLTVRDSRGLADPTPATVTVTVAAPNQAPNGTITAPATIVAGQAVTFQGAGTDPDNNTPLTFSWNFGTGATPATSTAQNPSVTFAAAGTYTVTLTVRDSRGLADPTPASVTVTVLPANQAPNGTIAFPAGNTTWPRGTAITFRGTGTDPDNNTPLTYSWAFGANATPGTSTAQNPTVTFGANGTNTVQFTVRDAKGLADPTPATVTVTVVDPLPISRSEMNDGDLRVEGSGAPAGSTVTLKNASTGATVASRLANSDGTWRFRIANPTSVPCTIRVEAGTRVGIRNVSNAPSSCVR